jgi:hypothetical protein
MAPRVSWSRNKETQFYEYFLQKTLSKFSYQELVGQRSLNLYGNFLLYHKIKFVKIIANGVEEGQTLKANQFYNVMCLHVYRKFF